ncbi:MAG TPA: 4Fe-4S dicluster domain-containing protein [Desulfobaccales bacterium]
MANVRRWIVQLLLDESPESPQIQELAKTFGVTPSRFKKKGVDLGCHLCGLCARACQEVAGVQILTFSNRGLRREITTPYHQNSADCIRCGTCLYICPTGAMEKMFPQVSAP